MEDKTIQELIHYSKQKLVNLKILKPIVMSKKIAPQHAHEADNNDWRYLSLAQVI
jgi:asparagine synthase (glutamine-hydrolysing)